MNFKPTEKQHALWQLISQHYYTMAFGGGRSGKTAGIIAYMILRAFQFPKSKQVIIRNTLKNCRASILKKSFPEILEVIDPRLHKEWIASVAGQRSSIKVNMTDGEVTFENGSTILFMGLDDHNKEAILGHEFVTVYINECSQVDSYDLVELCDSRLAQSVKDANGNECKPRMIFDCNPPSKSHWVYRAFIQGVHPTDRTEWNEPGHWASILMNPMDNEANLAAGYIEKKRATWSVKQQRRMLDGEFSDEVEGALFKPEWIADQRISKNFEWAKLNRIIVAVDPAVTSNQSSDETGIIVAGIDEDEHVYILDDCTLKGTPHQWATAVSEAYAKWQANSVVAEVNQGGDLVKTNLRIANPTIPVTMVRASRGKVVRADEVSALYEEGRVSHVGHFKDLEEQMESFTLDYNRTKQGSPDRLDALVWAVTSLAVKTVKPRRASHGVVAGF